MHDRYDKEKLDNSRPHLTPILIENFDNSINESSNQSPNSSTIIDQSKANPKLISEKFPLERTVTQDAEELGIIVPKTRNIKFKHSKSKNESDGIFDNSNKLLPRSTFNKPAKSITYGNNTIREESSDSEEYK